MKKVPVYLIGFSLMGLGVGLGLALAAAYAKAHFTGGIEEETVGIYGMVSILIFGPARLMIGQWVEGSGVENPGE
jgi:hypothetical protein